MELFKSKVALLHESDIKALVNMYDAKIENLVKDAENA